MAGSVYVVFSESLGSLKIGISSNLSGARVSQHTQYGWVVLQEWTMARLESARKVEREVLRELRVDRNLPAHLTAEQMPQGGWTETVSAGLIDSEELVALVDRFASEEMAEDGISGEMRIDGERVAVVVSPDSRGRINLSRMAQNKLYTVEVNDEGVITLTPSVVISEKEYAALTPIRPVLSPEEAFGRAGAIEAAQAVQDNVKARGIGSTRIRTSAALHDLIWDGAA
ncbi:hypothetical protein SEA_SATIS_177 [Streptomyces phage Satis]|nr:hypothetical protein SEA_SATIS_177 [Streptomyces phage Satis]